MSNHKYKQLQQVCKYVSTKTDISNVNLYNYISTENMVQDKGGVTIATTIPNSTTVSSYKCQDILTSNIRPYFKKIWFATKDGGCSNDVLVLRANKNENPKFIYYVLSSNDFFNYATVTSKGTKMPRGSKTAIMKYLVPDISLQTQQKIADILSTYDDLIENNNRRIELLEKTAENLYKEWFVRFRFPDYKKTKFENGLPKGWTVEKLSDMAKIQMGQSPKSEHYNENNIGLPFHQGVTNFNRRFPSHEVFCTDLKRIAEKGDILLSVRAPVGRINIANVRLIIGRGLCSIRHKTNNNTFLYYQLNQVFHKEDLIGNGAVFNSVGKEELYKVKVVSPDKNIIINFESIIRNIDDEINILEIKNQNLIKQRDLLLPRLMSGKLEI